MRLHLAASLAFVSSLGIAQDAPVLLSGRPDVIVTVKKSDVGADYVRIQMLAEDYPAELLRTQVQNIGKYNESQIRGLEITNEGGGGAGRILSASFATDRLMDQTAGTLELEAFAKAFAGAPEPNTIQIIAVMYENFKPSKTVTVAQWAGNGTEVSSAFDTNLNIVEYRVKLTTQDPDEISIPGTLSESTKSSEPASNKGLNPWVVAGILCGAAVIGVSVYFAMRPRAPKAEGPGQER
jgi:hypothetical protein